MAHITSGFSFAFLQECFVATLLVLAREEDETVARPFDDENEDLDDYKLWVAFRKQAETLRKEVEGQERKKSQLAEWCMGSDLASPIDGVLPTLARQQSCLTCQHDGRGTLTSAVGALRMQDDVLPALPYNGQKHRYFNSTCFELR